MPSRWLHAALQSSVVIAVVGLASSVATGTARADSCLTVDATGACVGTGPAIPSQTVGGSTTVPSLTTPSVSVPAPTSVCLLITCIAKGDNLVSVPSVTTPTETVPLPQETTPAVTVPVGNPTLQTFLITCTERFPAGTPLGAHGAVLAVESADPFVVLDWALGGAFYAAGPAAGDYDNACIE